MEKHVPGFAVLLVIVMVGVIVAAAGTTFYFAGREQPQQESSLAGETGKEAETAETAKTEIRTESKAEEKLPVPQSPEAIPAHQEPQEESPKPSSPSVTSWDFDFYNQVWRASNNPSSCPTPLSMQTPVEISKATGLLYPGQYRGGDYKTHGGFRFGGATNAATVRAPIDAYVYRAARYLQDGETQYLFFFINPCGIMYKFDHLLALTPKLQEIANDLPPAKPNDSRTTDITERITVRIGEALASEVGIKNTKNVFVDFGVYDLRRRNQISKDQSWAALHQNYKETDFYAICFLGLLPAKDASVLKTLPAGKEGKTSDYCQPSVASSENEHSSEGAGSGYGMKPPFYSTSGLSTQFYWPGEESFSSDETEVLVLNQTGSDSVITSAEIEFYVDGKMYPIFSGTWEKFPTVSSWDKIEYINIGKGKYTENLNLENGRKGKLHWHIDFGGKSVSGAQRAVIKIKLLKDSEVINVEKEFNRNFGSLGGNGH